jgi:hypothetical protein
MNYAAPQHWSKSINQYPMTHVFFLNICREGTTLARRMSAVARLTACPRLTLAACRVSMRSAAAAPRTALFSTSAARTDIDSAAKFIGAGAATVGVAGSGAGIGSGKLGFNFKYKCSYNVAV